MHIPYALQLAHAWTKLSLYVNLISVFILVPLIVYLTRHYGAVGGASAWVILNAGYVLVSTPVMYKYLLPTEKWRWYREDVGVPLSVSLITAGLGRLFLPKELQPLALALYLAFVSAATLGLAAMATATTRTWVLGKLSGPKTA